MRTENDFKQCLVAIQDAIDLLDGKASRLVAENSRLKARVSDLENATMSERDIEAMGWMKLPVGADGEPIRPGQTVYNGGRACEVAGAAGSCVWVRDPECARGWRACEDPKLFTHAEPDSWERLEADVGKVSCEYFLGDTRDSSCEGCPAKGIPGSCTVVKARDLVRRARALAGATP